MARTVRLSPEAETKLAELASLMGQSKNSVIERPCSSFTLAQSAASG